MSEQSENLKRGAIPKKITHIEQTIGDGEITPSPIIGSRHNNHDQKKEKDHNNSCGCGDCFVKLCKKGKYTTRESMTQLIDNFIKNRKSETISIEHHKKDCMCTIHLAQHRARGTQFLEKFIVKEINSNINKRNISMRSSRNHTNLTNLT